jgi:hypothetical protein
MGVVIQFPARKPDKGSIEEGCRAILSEPAIGGRFPQSVKENAVKNVVAVADRWWRTIHLSFTPQVDFTQEQLAEVERLCIFAAEKTYEDVLTRVMAERLLHELEIETGRPRSRSA